MDSSANEGIQILRSSILKPILWGFGIFIILFLMLYKVSTTVDLTSDFASIVLEAQSVLSGNIFLTGWSLTNISFYTTDLPFYVLFMIFTGFKHQLMNLVPTFIYVGVILLSLYLSIRHMEKKHAPLAITTLLILLAFPAPFTSQIVLVGPIHMGTILIMLVAFVFLVQNGRYSSWLYALFMMLAIFGDSLAFFTGAVPVFLGYVIHLFRTSDKSEKKKSISILLLTIISVVTAQVLLKLVDALGGFKITPLKMEFIQYEQLFPNIVATFKWIISIYGVNFFGSPLINPSLPGIMLHIPLFIFVLVVAFRAIRRVWTSSDTLNNVLVIAMIINLAAYILSTPYASDSLTARYIMPMFVFSAILSARNVELISKLNHKYVLAGLLALFFLVFLPQLVAEPKANQHKELTDYLEQQHLTSGYGTFWIAALSTVESDGKVTIRTVAENQGKIAPHLWFAQKEWYTKPANFVVFDESNWGNVNEELLLKNFGPVLDKKSIGPYTIMVWDKDISMLIDTTKNISN